MEETGGVQSLGRKEPNTTEWLTHLPMSWTCFSFWGTEELDIYLGKQDLCTGRLKGVSSEDGVEEIESLRPKQCLCEPCLTGRSLDSTTGRCCACSRRAVRSSGCGKSSDHPTARLVPLYQWENGGRLELEGTLGIFDTILFLLFFPILWKRKLRPREGTGVVQDHVTSLDQQWDQNPGPADAEPVSLKCCFSCTPGGAREPVKACVDRSKHFLILGAINRMAVAQWTAILSSVILFGKCYVVMLSTTASPDT